MASSGGSGGGDVPAERAAAAVNDLMEAREGAARLRGFLQEQSSPWAELVDRMMDKMSSAMSALETAAAVRQTAESSAAGGTTRKRRRGSSGSRSRRPSDRRVAATLADGHIWRKYGQKEIQNSRNPRSYYRCTHKSTQGCAATRHVHVSETDPSRYAITYYGEHSCSSDPSTIPPTTVVDAAARTASDARANNLISFAPGRPAAAGGAYSQWEGGGTTTQLCSSWTCATSELSSSAEPLDELAAVVGSAGMTVGSAPDYGGICDMAAAGAGSFPSSPNSLGLVVGSLESFGDVFLFDP